MELTAPQDAEVVTDANRLLAAMPRRTSFPSMLPPAWAMVCVWSTPNVARSGFPTCSKWVTAIVKARKIASIAEKMATPCLLSETMRPNVKHKAAGIRKMHSISSRLAKAVGFSKGWAELVLKKPPPLVPSSLMESCDATGPMARTWVSEVLVSSTGSPFLSSTISPFRSLAGSCQIWVSMVWTSL